jgi:hypothetical protein
MYFFKPYYMLTIFSKLCHFRLSQFLAKFPSLCFKTNAKVFSKNLKLLQIVGARSVKRNLSHTNDPQLWSEFEPYFYLALYARCK